MSLHLGMVSTISPSQQVAFLKNEMGDEKPSRFKTTYVTLSEASLISQILQSANASF